MLIGISGKIGSGKDLTGKIIQALTDKPGCFDGMDVITEKEVSYKVWDVPTFSNRKFADTLKDFICMLLGCTRERLEDRDFKEAELPEEWWYYKLGNGTILPRGYYPNEEDNQICEKRYLVKTTPRLLLQLMGTECGRDILHPNVWVNALMSGYKENFRHCNNCNKDYSLKESVNRENENLCCPNCNTLSDFGYNKQNFIITDMRFPNELEAVKSRKGITIRVNRGTVERTGKVIIRDEHPSETGLDNATFDYVIENNGTIKDLVDQIRIILIKEKLI